MGARDRDGLRGWRRATLVAIKTVHTAAFFSIGSCLVYFAYSSLAKRSDRRAAIAGAVVTGETIVYALNGFRCPLTSLAERLGSEHGSVADIYLPPWIEDHLPYVTGPIFAGAVVLHARNILRSREHSTALPKIRRGMPLGTMRRSSWYPVRWRDSARRPSRKERVMTFLVSAASRYGSTAEIAWAIGDVLSRRGFDVSVTPSEEVAAVEEYDAVILGSAVYMGHWLDSAKEFARRLFRGLEGDFRNREEIKA